MKISEKEYWQSVWDKFGDGDREVFKTIYNEFIDVLFAYGSRITSNTSLHHIIYKLEWFYNIHFQFDNFFKRSVQVISKLDMPKE